MKILAFDTSAKVASVALTDGAKLLGVSNIDNGLTQSELLLPMAKDMLDALKISIEDIDLLACSVGPGSFTGVRIGVSLVKGLAFERQIPTVAVSTLEALAQNLYPLDGVIVPVMDARRAQVYTALFTVEDGELKRLSPDEAISLTELEGRVAEYDRVYLVGDGYDTATRALAGKVKGLCPTPIGLRGESAASVALCAERAYARGEAIPDTEILPTYLRMPQAERERLERLNNSN